MERKELLMMAVVALLLISTASQTFALAAMADADVTVATQSSQSSTQSTSGSATGSSSGTPVNLQNLPGMVGGC
ncbi:MAG: hypothetical protein L0958_03990 [Candidatus Mariimomonas ferrooxydans]